MNTTQFQKVFPIGTHLCHGTMPPMSELKADMENVRRRGFNMIKLQEQWGFDEPLEGQVDLSRYEELIEHAAGLDLAVYLGLTCEHVPSWLWHKYPDCHLMRCDGSQVLYEAQTNIPSDGKPGLCHDHPEALAAELRFIRTLVETLGRFENIVVWGTWQEVWYWGEPVCYCENTLAFFREWLKEKYGDLAGLNRAWKCNYGDWQYVVPDRGDRVPTALPHDVDWHTFMDNVQIARVLQERARVIREADPFERPVLTHRSTPILGSAQDWTYARCQDFLGQSSYPAWNAFLSPWDDWKPGPSGRFERHDALLGEMWDNPALRTDYIRSANRPAAPVWVTELQGGPVSANFHEGRVPSPDDIRRWMLTHVGSGATALSFWITRSEVMAYEINGFSLLDSEGDSTPRLEEAARVGRALNEHPDLFAEPTLPRAQAAILVNEENYQLCRSMHLGAAHLNFCVRGWHRLLWDGGYGVDFVEAGQLGEGAIREYRAVVVPFPISMSEKVARQLAQYVGAGGNLICEACPGRMDEHAWPTRGELSPTMRELFGVRHESITMIREPNDGARWSVPEQSWGDYLEAAMLEGCGPLDGHRLRANVRLQTYTCEGGEPILSHEGSVAGVVREVGKGKAWLLGTFIGHNGTAYRDESTRAAVCGLLGLCGVSPEHEGQLLLRRRVAEGKQAWLFTNPTRERVEERICVKGWAQVSDLMGGPLQRDGGSVALAVESLDVRVLILESE